MDHYVFELFYKYFDLQTLLNQLYELSFLATHKCEKCIKTEVYVTFLKRVLSELKYIFEFDRILPHFLTFFVSYLSHFGF